ncbi:MAG TPA: hypothetical protein VH416_06135 [Gaiellaceae bacterium]
MTEDDAIAAANEALRAKGYGERDLAVHATPMPSKALLKGNRIVSPFSDSPETVLQVARELVPPAAELKGMLRPGDLRSRLEAS